MTVLNALSCLAPEAALGYKRGEASASIVLAKLSNRAATGRKIGTGWSLKRQIRILGLLLAATIALASGLAIEFAQHSEKALVAEAQRQLVSAARKLRESYENALSSPSKRSLQVGDSTSSDTALHALTSAALASFPGVEGGFYASRTGTLVGYAYPTYQGSGPKTDVPAAERGSIIKTAQAACAAQGSAELRVRTGNDVILFYALALRPSSNPADAVWVMHHLVGVRSTYGRFQGLSMALLLVACALATGVAWVVTRRLDRGVAAIEDALHAMAGCLDTPVGETGICELDRIGAAVSELARALDENQKRRDELEHRLRQADRLAALGRLVAAVAHEVRNPLASIKLRLALAKKPPGEPQRIAAAFDVIGSEVERIDRIVARLLDLGKASKTTSTPTYLRGFLAERMRAYEPRALAQGTRVELAVANSVDTPIAIDRDRLGQIIDNLIINALDAVPAAGGRVLIEAERPAPRQLVIRVKDNGPGIPADLRQRIFEPFVTTKQAGTGLGLFISAQLARAMGGELLYRDLQPPVRSATEGEISLAGANFELVVPC
jgi:signal transduction histidine kinase